MNYQTYTLGEFQVWEYEEAGSTNTVAASLPSARLQDKSVVLTFCQTRGKGQVGNSWESEPGKNISLTVIFKPHGLEAGKQFAVSMIIALGCRDYLSRYVKECTIKWPNDVYIGDRKISGILIEHTLAGAFVSTSLCGIGVNINQHEFLSDAPNPVSLFQLTGREIPIRQAVADLLECIGKRYQQVHEEEALKKDFLQSLYRREGIYEWEDEEGRFRACIAGIDEYGRLILKDEEGKERIYGFKEVKYLESQ